MFKAPYLFLSLIVFFLSSCSTLVEEKRSAYQLFTTEKSPLKQTQEPWQLSVECLSERKLFALADEGKFSPVDPHFTTVAVKLRVQSQNSQSTIPDLLAQQVPLYSTAQAQDALFYHMAKAGYLQVQGKQVYPQAAYSEMTTQREKCVDLVFVFSLPRQALVQRVPIKFVLDKAFFLAQPVEFVLSATQLLPAA
jgi:hypothetical protein